MWDHPAAEQAIGRDYPYIILKPVKLLPSSDIRSSGSHEVKLAPVGRNYTLTYP